MKIATSQMPVLEERVLLQLLPRDEADERDVILEVRAGTGGDEASLFAGHLFRMYTRHAQLQGWRFEPIEVRSSPLLRHCECTHWFLRASQ